MIDKVTLNIWKDNTTEPILRRLAESLIDSKTTINESGEAEYIRGKFNGLSVMISDKRASLTGSVTKYLTGSNFNTMRQRDLSETVCRLSDDVGLEANKIWVSSLEIGDTFVMEDNPMKYIQQLINTAYLPRFHKETIQGSLYFKQKAKQRELVFYDKVAEMMHRKEPIPTGLYNLLRYELRLQYSAVKRFLPTRTLADLNDRQVFETLKKEWRNYFETMYKTANTAKRGRGRTETLLQYIYLLQKRAGVEASDLSDYLNDTMRGKPNAYRLKQKVADYFALQGQENNGLLKELRDRVTEAVL